MIDKKALFASGRPKSEAVTVPGLTEPLNVSGMSAAQRSCFFTKVFDAQGKTKDGVYFAAELVAVSVIDDEGQRVFDDEDIADLGKMAPEFIDPLFEAAQRLSGLDSGAKDEAEKN